jgi:GNAT superfamily N-acetyltransferase
MNNLTIRKAASSDVEKIVELGLLLQQHAEKSNPFIWRITEEGKSLLKQKVESDLTASNVVVLLAEVDGEVIGYVRGEVSSRSDHTPRTVGQVSRMYVLKQFRRKGVGRGLIEELCSFFDSNKVEDLTVRYVIGNKKAESFWEKLGFEPVIMTSGTYPEDLNSRLKVMAQ